MKTFIKLITLIVVLSSSTLASANHDNQTEINHSKYDTIVCDFLSSQSPNIVINRIDFNFFLSALERVGFNCAIDSDRYNMTRVINGATIKIQWSVTGYNTTFTKMEIK
jgi:hypothetical protein